MKASSVYLNGRGGYLQVVESLEGALSIREIRRSQLVQDFQRYGGNVPGDLRFLAELLFVQEYSKRLLTFWERNEKSNVKNKITNQEKKHLCLGTFCSEMEETMWTAVYMWKKLEVMNIMKYD